jgi:hypothetical protein
MSPGNKWDSSENKELMQLSKTPNLFSGTFMQRPWHTIRHASLVTVATIKRALFFIFHHNHLLFYSSHTKLVLCRNSYFRRL